MKLLVTCINYDPEIISTGIYTTGLADYMSRNGVETHAVTARPYYPAWRTFEGWRSPTWKARTTESGVHVVHCPIYVPAKPSGARRILHYISFAMTSFPILSWKALRHRPDLIVMIAPSMISALGVLAVARLSGATTWMHIQNYEVEGAGIIVPSADPEALTKALAALLDDPEQRAALGAAVRARALERWDMNAILSRLKTSMETLTTKAVPHVDTSGQKDSSI